MELLSSFFNDDRVKGLLLLLFAQTLIRIGYALKTWTFDLTKLADFYKSKVVFYVFGCFGVYVATRYMPASMPLGEYTYVVSEGTFSLLWGLLIANIAGDILLVIDAATNKRLIRGLERIPGVKALGLSKARL